MENSEFSLEQLRAYAAKNEPKNNVLLDANDGENIDKAVTIACKFEDNPVMAMDEMTAVGIPEDVIKIAFATVFPEIARNAVPTRLAMTISRARNYSEYAIQYLKENLAKIADYAYRFKEAVKDAAIGAEPKIGYNLNADTIDGVGIIQLKPGKSNYNFVDRKFVNLSNYIRIPNDLDSETDRLLERGICEQLVKPIEEKYPKFYLDMLNSKMLTEDLKFEFIKG